MSKNDLWYFPDWRCEEIVYPSGDHCKMVRIFDANGSYVGELHGSVAWFVCDAINNYDKLKKQLARYKGEVEELGRMLDDK